ncbi:MAG: type VI secretion system-associated protein TagF [Zoogloeaceae bacterium]|nr:type VI secretion system-associated protein TagF [Zoogloeaceae bacterium]
MAVSAPAPGWYGKLPVLGDFASRRLPHAFVSSWDTWLQRGMSHSQEELGQDWLEVFLTAPLWRFVLGPQTLEAQGWAGVLLPSVDSVGRYFPLTLCAPLPVLSFDEAAQRLMEQWMDALEGAARVGLDPQRGLDQFEAELTGIAPLVATAHETGGGLAQALLRREPLVRLERAGARNLNELAGAVATELIDGLLAPYTLWWCRDSDGVAGGFACHGMPSAAVFSRMLQYVPGQA